MIQPDKSSRRPGLWTALAATAVAGATVITIALPPSEAVADPVPPAPTTTAPAAPAPAPADPNAPVQPAPAPADPNAAGPAPAPAPADPNAPAPAPAPVPADPNAPAPAPADPNAPAAPAPAPAPEPGRVNNSVGGFSYVLPAGWEVADASRLSYGQALLLKQTGPAQPGQPATTANDTSILLGRLDLKLFAGAEPDNGKAAVRLASDMGEFFMPFPGSRINQQSAVLQAGDMPGAAASYDVKFTDAAKPNGQIWAGVVGSAGNPQAHSSASRWFVVWLGTSKDPIDTPAAKALAQSIRPYTAPPPPPAPVADPNAPVVPPAPGNRIGVPVPVTTPVPEMMPGG
ncbi:MAG: APA family fibronectin-binding glycoprotein [Mycobacterium sp.]